jgi:hypothetical protein
MVEITVIRENPHSLVQLGVFLRENSGVSRATSDTISRTILSTRVGFCSCGVHIDALLLNLVRWFPPGVDMSSVRVQIDPPRP